eukprot:4208889-Alexandrium_andersonii.AAC.1
MDGARQGPAAASGAGPGAPSRALGVSSTPLLRPAAPERAARLHCRRGRHRPPRPQRHAGARPQPRSCATHQ